MKASPALSVIGLVAAFLFILVWGIPTLAGPEVECIDTEREVCEQMWRFSASQPQTDLLFFPVTRAVVSEGGCSLRLESAYGLFHWTAIC